MTEVWIKGVPAGPTHEIVAWFLAVVPQRRK